MLLPDALLYQAWHCQGSMIANRAKTKNKTNSSATHFSSGDSWHCKLFWHVTQSWTISKAGDALQPDPKKPKLGEAGIALSKNILLGCSHWLFMKVSERSWPLSALHCRFSNISFWYLTLAAVQWYLKLDKMWRLLFDISKNYNNNKNTKGCQQGKGPEC